jgi:hypothetical protein
MSVATEPGQVHADRAEPATPCEQCGSPMRPDQEWCFECGSARTLVHPPPDWRIAAAIVTTVLVLVLAGFAIALISLSNQSNRTIATTSTVTVTATTPAPTTARAKQSAAIPGWPIALPGWTVVLFSSTTRKAATAKAKQLAAAGVHVGVLSTSRHPSGNMPPGRYAVFTGRYPTPATALPRAKELRARGYKARVRRVGIPGAR